MASWFEAPPKPVIFTAFSFVSISVDINFLGVVVILFLKRNHIWSWFSADTGTRGGTRQTQTCDSRPCTGGRPGSRRKSVPQSGRSLKRCEAGQLPQCIVRRRACKADSLYAQELLGSPQPPRPHMAPPTVRALTFTAGGPRVRPSSGSARSATCRHGDATHGSPQTGWYGAGPAHPCTA